VGKAVVSCELRLVNTFIHQMLVNTFIHQMVPDLLKRDEPIKVVINFKSWYTTRDISSE
jgi:hypothetical protein